MCNQPFQPEDSLNLIFQNKGPEPLKLPRKAKRNSPLEILIFIVVVFALIGVLTEVVRLVYLILMEILKWIT